MRVPSGMCPDIIIQGQDDARATKARASDARANINYVNER
jgi:hypothetical protein